MVNNVLENFILKCCTVASSKFYSFVLLCYSTVIVVEKGLQVTIKYSFTDNFLTPFPVTNWLNLMYWLNAEVENFIKKKKNK